MRWKSCRSLFFGCQNQSLLVKTVLIISCDEKIIMHLKKKVLMIEKYCSNYKFIYNFVYPL